jgi:hypothetical protein
VFAVDILACPDCGGRLRLVATIEARAVIERILAHLGLPLDPPPRSGVLARVATGLLRRRIRRRRLARLKQKSRPQHPSEPHWCLTAPPAITVILHTDCGVEPTREQFFRLCALNHDLRLERSAEGDIIVMPPAGGRTGARNSSLLLQIAARAKADGSGFVFDSSTGFELPDGATRSPDVAWVLRARLARLTPEQRERFLPLCRTLCPTDLP